MALLKDQQTGSSGDPFTVAGTLVSSGTVDITGAFRLDGTAGASGQVLLSAGGSNTPTWGNAFVAGMIMLWSGSSATIPSGWLLCDGSNSTPDLRNRFVVGATSTYAVGATGGSADAIVVSHTHTGTSTVSDPSHLHNIPGARAGNPDGGGPYLAGANSPSAGTDTAAALTGISVSTSISTTGSSGTNANLPPYYALCYIMKS
jgi:microcystin-dependent protein